MTAVAKPPVQSPVPWECPTWVWALLPWLGRPMTPHFCSWRPGAGGRSYTAFHLSMRGWYRALSDRHNLPRHDGCHITPGVAARIGPDEATSITLSLLHVH